MTTQRGTLITKRKEEIQLEIERQQELGSGVLLEEDNFLAELRLEELESTNGDRQEYWLLAIKLSRKARTIQACMITRDRKSVV